jgi:C4-dicarboxylate-specific signal transduction histidine kinase
VKRKKIEQQGLGIGLALSLLIIHSQNGQLIFEDLQPNGIKTEILLNL